MTGPGSEEGCSVHPGATRLALAPLSWVIAPAAVMQMLRMSTLRTSVGAATAGGAVSMMTNTASKTTTPLRIRCNARLPSKDIHLS
jgi:hypothetical protein